MNGFAELHTDDGQPMFVRPEEVNTIRSAMTGGCYIVTKGGPHFLVTETPYEAAEKIESAMPTPKAS